MGIFEGIFGGGGQVKAPDPLPIAAPRTDQSTVADDQREALRLRRRQLMQTDRSDLRVNPGVSAPASTGLSTPLRL